jgi:hypothetical protein
VHQYVGILVLGANVISPRAVQFVVVRESHYWNKTPTKRATYVEAHIRRLLLKAQCLYPSCFAARLRHSVRSSIAGKPLLKQHIFSPTERVRYKQQVAFSMTAFESGMFDPGDANHRANKSWV